MSGFWEELLGLNDQLSIWIEEEDLGKERVIHHKDKRCFVTIPQEINKTTTLRIKGLGKTKMLKTGDLLLHVWLNKREDVRKTLWLSETSARNGVNKKLFTGEKIITMVVPPKSNNGTTIRLRSLGRGSNDSPNLPVLGQPKRGDLLVKLLVYSDIITPRYQPFDALSTETMALEGWVYRKFDEVVQKIGRSSLPVEPIQASVIADSFNIGGWSSIFDLLVNHFKLTQHKIELETSTSITVPGNCQRMPIVHNNTIRYTYKVTIQEQFLDNPFAITSILAHELCHVVYTEKVDDRPKSTGFVMKTKEAILEEERMVDLLVFMFKLGEFQLRVARDKRLTLGYFDQEVFERIQVIVSRKHRSSH